MGPANFAGFWIFPLIMMVICLVMMFVGFTFFRRGGGGLPFMRDMDDRQESPRNSSSNGESPLEILQRRYANGEISKAEYDEIRQNLEK